MMVLVLTTKRIAEKALEKGIVSRDEVESMSQMKS